MVWQDVWHRDGGWLLVRVQIVPERPVAPSHAAVVNLVEEALLSHRHTLLSLQQVVSVHLHRGVVCHSTREGRSSAVGRRKLVAGSRRALGTARLVRSETARELRRWPDELADHKSTQVNSSQRGKPVGLSSFMRRAFELRVVLCAEGMRRKQRPNEEKEHSARDLRPALTGATWGRFRVRADECQNRKEG